MKEENNKQLNSEDLKQLNKINQSITEDDLLGVSEEPLITEEDKLVLDAEAQLDDKYGDQTTKAASLGAARGLSFGLSDVALKKLGIFSEEDLREIDERNRGASITGEVAGVAAPLLLSGGTSAIAKGASVAGKGVLAADKAGRLVESITAKALKNAVGKESIAKQIVKNSIPKSAGYATEGAFYGAGDLISENALGRADLNAENLAASVGVSALISGAAGPIFSTAGAIVPVLKNNKIVDYVVKKLPKADVNEAAAKLSGLTPTNVTKLKSTRPDIYENLPNYYKNRLDLKVLDSPEVLAERSLKSIKTIGTEIDEILTKIDSFADDAILPSKAEVGLNIQKSLDTLAEDFKGLPSAAAKKEFKKDTKEIDSWNEWVNSTEKLTARELKEAKTKMQNLAKYEKKYDSISLEEKMARDSAEVLREGVLKVADNVSPENPVLGTKLRQANLDYGTAIKVTKELAKKADKLSDKSFTSFKDILFADIAADIGGAGLAGVGIAAKKYLQSDFRRKLQILKSVEKANKTMQSNISKSVKSFFDKSAKPAKAASLNILANSTFSLPENKKKPANKQEAFTQIRENLSNFQAQPDLLIDRLTKNSIRMSKVAPETANELNNTAMKAITFLQDKIPKSYSNNSIVDLMSKREYKPSSIELSKFERYVEAVENPSSILEDLKQGTLTREKVEAIQYVYPNLYDSIRQEVLDNITSGELELTYQKRIQAGILLDLPTDVSLEPANILALQQLFAQDQQAQQAEEQKSTDKPINPTMSGLKNIKKSERTDTSMQKSIYET